MVSLQAQVPLRQLSTATSVLMFAQIMGNAIFLAVANAIFADGLSSKIPQFAPGVDPGKVIGAGATGFRGIVPAEQILGVLEAYAISNRHVFYLAVGTGGLAVLSSIFMGSVDVRAKESGSEVGQL